MKPNKVPTDLLRHPVERYLTTDPYHGDESEIDCRLVDIVQTRKSAYCTMGKSEHPPGTVMWRERALVDGQFQTNRLCLPHVAICIDFADGGEHDPYSFNCAAAAAHVPEQEEEERELNP